MAVAEREYAREISALFAKCFRAYLECSDEAQAVIRDMVAVLNSADADEEEREMALNTLAEALFPSYDSGELGIEVGEADKACAENSQEGREARAALDLEERTFAERVQAFMTQKGLTQAQLAEKAGVRQPAVSMMLTRRCRPQRRTVHKLAEALGVKVEDLWPY
jgi:lambda repressor-like predicted transcriptional regulator